MPARPLFVAFMVVGIFCSTTSGETPAASEHHPSAVAAPVPLVKRHGLLAPAALVLAASLLSCSIVLLMKGRKRATVEAVGEPVGEWMRDADPA